MGPFFGGFSGLFCAGRLGPLLPQRPDHELLGRWISDIILRPTDDQPLKAALVISHDGAESTAMGPTKQHLLAIVLNPRRVVLVDSETDLFSRGYQEGIAFPKFVERSILNLPLFKL